MPRLQVLIVDDEPAIRQVLSSKIEKAGHAVQDAANGEAAVELLATGEFDVCVCDIRMPGLDGVEVLRRSRAGGVETAFLMMTAYASVDTAIEAMKEGAFDYLTKPLRGEDVLRRLEQIAQIADLREENRRLRQQVQRGDTTQFVSTNGAMEAIERMVSKVAPTNGTVLITGESGTGKSVIAQRIHRNSLRADAPFLSVNCGAVPENLLESEFFGHVKGAFTGADRAKRGLFYEADGGTLLLDEICELPLALQVKLLHALEEKKVRPVGSEQDRQIDARIIAATNRNVSKMVAEGKFREDLYYRLNVLEITMPPLRERGEDIPDLIRFFLARESARLGLPQALEIDPVAEELLLTHDWPGNLRELQNVIARALVLADGSVISVADLPRLGAEDQAGGAGSSGKQGSEMAGSLRDRVRYFESEQIRQTLREANGDRHAAAKELGIGLSTLYRKLEESDPPRNSGDE